MEPGGIEPPSRDSQQDASTRVVAGLISPSERAATPSPQASLRKISRRSTETLPWRQPDVFRTPPYRALRGVRRGLIRLREHNCACCQLLCVRAFDEASTPLDAQHPAFPVRSIPIGPTYQRATQAKERVNTTLSPPILRLPPSGCSAVCAYPQQVAGVPARNRLSSRRSNVRGSGAHLSC